MKLQEIVVALKFWVATVNEPFLKVSGNWVLFYTLYKNSHFIGTEKVANLMITINIINFPPKILRKCFGSLFITTRTCKSRSNRNIIKTLLSVALD